MSARSASRIKSFEFQEGQLLLSKYRVIEKLGAGYEGEVYRVREVLTGVDRAAKFFFPHRNENNRALKYYARKLHKLRHCPIVIQYVTEEHLEFQGRRVTFLVSEFAEGKVLTEFLREQPTGRLTPFEALHLIQALAKGMATVHRLKESHGDLHTHNVMVMRRGLEFDVKVIDFFQWEAAKGAKYLDDVVGMVNILYDCVGGARHYRRQPPVIKNIVRGLKESLIGQRFKTPTQLRDYLETLTWD